MLAGEKADQFDEIGGGDIHMDMIADVGNEQSKFEIDGQG